MPQAAAYPAAPGKGHWPSGSFLIIALAAVLREAELGEGS